MYSWGFFVVLFCVGFYFPCIYVTESSPGYCVALQSVWTMELFLFLLTGPLGSRFLTCETKAA